MPRFGFRSGFPHRRRTKVSSRAVARSLWRKVASTATRNMCGPAPLTSCVGRRHFPWRKSPRSNRRQGPDLQNVGARRRAEWQRLHLQSPRVLTPGSRMPSYAHLFAPTAHGAGEALLAYLASLGKGRQAALEAKANDWRPVSDTGSPVTEPRRLYAEYCTGCHGAAGQGDGPLAAQLKRAPRDLTKAEWIAVPRAARGLAELQALERTIKYGISGSAMAGREYLTDAEVVALAKFVQSLRITP